MAGSGVPWLMITVRLRVKMLEHALERQLLAEAALVEPSIGDVGDRRPVLVDLNQAGLDLIDEAHRVVEVPRPQRRGEAVFGGVRLVEHGGEVLPFEDDRDGPEDFLLGAR